MTRYEDNWEASETFLKNVGQIVTDYAGIETCILDMTFYMMRERSNGFPQPDSLELRNYVNEGWQSIVGLINALPNTPRYGTFLNSRIATARKVRNFTAHATLVSIDETNVASAVVNLRTGGIVKGKESRSLPSGLIGIPLMELSEAAGFVSTLREFCDDIYDHFYDCGYSIDAAFDVDVLDEPKFFIEHFLQNSDWLNSRVILSLTERLEKFSPEQSSQMPRDFLIEMLENAARGC